MFSNINMSLDVVVVVTMSRRHVHIAKDYGYFPEQSLVKSAPLCSSALQLLRTLEDHRKSGSRGPLVDFVKYRSGAFGTHRLPVNSASFPSAVKSGHLDSAKLRVSLLQPCQCGLW